MAIVTTGAKKPDRNVRPEDIAGQGLLVDLGSPFNGGKPTIDDLQLFLVEEEEYEQEADIPDEPILVQPTFAEEISLGGVARSDQQLVLDAIRSHYELRPFRVTVSGQMQTGETIEDGREADPTKLPGQKLRTILELMQDIHLVGYASEPLVDSGFSGFFKNMVILDFRWRVVSNMSNMAPFELVLQGVQAGRAPLFVEKALGFLESGLKILGGIALGAAAIAAGAAALGVGAIAGIPLALAAGATALAGLAAIQVGFMAGAIKNAAFGSDGSKEVTKIDNPNTAPEPEKDS